MTTEVITWLRDGATHRFITIQEVLSSLFARRRRGFCVDTKENCRKITETLDNK